MYLITGVSGNVGSEAVSQLLAAGHAVRVYVRDASKAAQWGDRVEVAVGGITGVKAGAGTWVGTGVGVGAVLYLGLAASTSCLIHLL